MVEFTTVKIPVKLLDRIRKKVKNESNGYVSTAEFVRSAVRNELKGSRSNTGPSRSPNKAKRNGKLDGPPPGMRVKGDPDPPGVIYMSIEEAKMGGSIGGGRLIEGRKDEYDDDDD